MTSGPFFQFRKKTRQCYTLEICERGFLLKTKIFPYYVLKRKKKDLNLFKFNLPLKTGIGIQLPLFDLELSSNKLPSKEAV